MTALVSVGLLTFAFAFVIGMCLNVFFNNDPMYFKNFNINMILDYMTWTNEPGKSIAWILTVPLLVIPQLISVWVQALTTNFTFLFLAPNLVAAYTTYNYYLGAREMQKMSYSQPEVMPRWKAERAAREMLGGST